MLFYIDLLLTYLILIRLDDAANSVILLANLIYFNGLWTESFDEKQTTPQQFWVDSKANLMTPFMTKISNLYYGESDELDAKFLRLPYNVNTAIPFCISDRNDFRTA